MADDNLTLESIHMTAPAQAGGCPLYEHQDYNVSADFAKRKYARGVARPSAEVYMERLIHLGLTGVEISETAPPAMRKAARLLGLSVSERPAKKG